MLVIGENIHIISPKVKAAIEEHDIEFFLNLARRQAAAGAGYVELNIGPSRKRGVEMMQWLVPAVQDVIDVPLSLDTTNADAIEAGLKLCKRKALINSTSAEQVRLDRLLPLAAEYKSAIIALTMTEQGIPNSADGRAELGYDLINAAAGYGITPDQLFLDPLTLPVSADQPGVQVTVEAIRMFKGLADPPVKTVVGLSNVSNGALSENRPLINRVFLVMLLGAGLDSAIIDPLDAKLMDTVRTVETQDASTGEGRLLCALYNAYAAGESISPDDVDMSDPAQLDIWKTVRVLRNDVIYADSYLRV
ncbi:MAG TPA: dihydropteroate synthase [Chloroflexota bacterium]|nr:dihydropteroate synthase [Chloroflexota bacterium]